MDSLEGVHFDDALPDTELEAVFDDTEFCSPRAQDGAALDHRGSTAGVPATTHDPEYDLQVPLAAERAQTRPAPPADDQGDLTPKRAKPAEADRIIFHVDVDSFYITAERIRSPALLNQPVGVMQHNRGGFVALSYEARRCGLVKGDAVGEQGRTRIHGLQGRKSLVECREACPELKVLSMDTPYYRKVSTQLQASIQDCLGPLAVVAKASIDDFYVDVTAIVTNLVDELSPVSVQALRCVHARDSLKLGTLRWESKQARHVPARWLQAYALAGRLRQHVAARFGTHFTLSVGMGSSKLVARLVSSLNKPEGQTCCLPSDNAIVAQCTPLKHVPSLRHMQGDQLLDLIASVHARKTASVRTSTRHRSKPKPKAKSIEPVMLAALLAVPKVQRLHAC